MDMFDLSFHGGSRRTVRRPRAAAVAPLMLVMAVLFGLAGGAQAANAPAPAEPAVQNRFGLSPTGPDLAATGPRTSFSFAIAPGGTGSDRVSVFNYGTQPTEFTLYASDGVDTAEGQFDVKPADHKPTDAGSWVELQQVAVVVPASSVTVVPFVVQVPHGASPGDHAAGIIAAVKGTATTASGQRVSVVSRAGVPLYVRVAGALHPRLSVTDMQSHYHRSALSAGRGSLDVSYRVTNTGNVRLAAHQQVAVTGLFGWPLQSRAGKDVPELLPGAGIVVHAHFNGVLPAIRVTSEVTLHPYSKQGALRPAPSVTRASSSVWAIPWLLLILVVLVGGWIFYRYRRRRRARAAVGAAPPSSPGPPSTDDRAPVEAGS
jgi:hypothetical protein